MYTFSFLKKILYLCFTLYKVEKYIGACRKYLHDFMDFGNACSIFFPDMFLLYKKKKGPNFTTAVEELTMPLRSSTQKL